MKYFREFPTNITTTTKHVAENLTWLIIALYKYFNKIVKLLIFTENVNSCTTPVLVLEGGMRYIDQRGIIILLCIAGGDIHYETLCDY